MVFSSITFLCVFLPIVIASYGMTKDIKIKNALLIIASILFYAYGEPVYVLLMLLCSYINYFMALQIEKNKTKFKLVVTLIADLGILCIFKYLGMLISTINILPGVNIPEPEITLPVGISFFTFHPKPYYNSSQPTSRSQKSNSARFCISARPTGKSSVYPPKNTITQRGF